MTGPSPGYSVIKTSTLAHLDAHYFAPLSGMRDIAAGLLDEWGHDSADHPELVAQMEVELSGALVETAADLMRDAGLRDLRIEPAPTTPAPAAG
ncbi:hypothetical protein [Streptomyces griseus]|uniref:hypothetical protein n=1 Tax=Streptomyces griseus TaxID=1911 RepID=UPI0036651E15